MYASPDIGMEVWYLQPSPSPYLMGLRDRYAVIAPVCLLLHNPYVVSICAILPLCRAIPFAALGIGRQESLVCGLFPCHTTPGQGYPLRHSRPKTGGALSGSLLHPSHHAVP